MTPEQKNRYNRQILLKEFGEEGQEKLLHGRVLVIGAGGLGCPVLLYLAGAGVGMLGIADFDLVDITNLHRQVLYTMDDIGKPKAHAAAARIKALNPQINTRVHDVKIDNNNAWDILSFYDLVVDGSDNFVTRYLIDDACRLLGKPLVYGSVMNFEGQVAVFHSNTNGAVPVSYRHLFPSPPEHESVPGCNEGGVIATLPGIIGLLQAQEVIKILTGTGSVLAGKVLLVQSLHNRFYEMDILHAAKLESSIPQNKEEFLRFPYNWFCKQHQVPDLEISIKEFDMQLLEKNTVLVDVREKGEEPAAEELHAVHIPLPALPKRMDELHKQSTILLFCQSGTRSRQAAVLIRERYPEKVVFSLQGGILAWKNYHQKISS